MIPKLLLVTVILFFLVLSLTALNDPEYHASIDAYVGSDYYPDRGEKEFSYSENLLLRIGGSLPVWERGRFYLDLINQSTFNDQSFLIDKFLYVHDLYLMNVSLGYDVVEIGNGSEIFKLSTKDPYYDNPLHADYHFTGIKIEGVLPRFHLKSLIGGNQYNSSVFLASIKYIRPYWNLGCYYLFTGRSNEQNLKTNSLGEELEIKTALFRFYQTVNLALTDNVKIYNWHSRDILDIFAEIVIKLYPDLKTGTNFLYKFILSPEEDITWRSQSFLKASFGNFSLIPQFLYYQTDDFTNREYELILGLNVDPKAWIGVSGSHFHPSLGGNYYQAGLQVKFNYEKI